MTPDELELLKAINGKNVETFLPAGRSAAHAKAFDELVERLQALKRLGWIELEVAGQSGRIGKYQRTYVAAVAGCTDGGRRALLRASLQGRGLRSRHPQGWLGRTRCRLQWLRTVGGTKARRCGFVATAAAHTAAR
jgi:hypothetical protein